MGGDAFPHLDVRRIQREHILPTMQKVVDELCIENLGIEYVKNSFLGSVGKQQTSGDIDLVLDENIFSMDTIHEIREKSEFKVKAGKTDPMVITAWEIEGADGYVQVDFLLGDVRWLQYSHHSPGTDVSPFKGVFIQTLMMLLPKMNKEFTLYDDKGLVADVGFVVDATRGVFRKWRLRRNNKVDTMDTVDPDTWETHIPIVNPPRIQRLAPPGEQRFISDPDDVVRLTLGDGVKPKDIDTFEKLWAIVRSRAGANLPPLESIQERFVNALLKTPVKKDYTRDQLNEVLGKL